MTGRNISHFFYAMKMRIGNASGSYILASNERASQYVVWMSFSLMSYAYEYSMCSWVGEYYKRTNGEPPCVVRA